jgi:hypothetical protein
VLWPDADGPGRRHMQRIGERFTALGIIHRVVDPWPDATDGRDAANFAGTDEELRTLLTTTPDATPSVSGVGVLLSEVTPEEVRWQWYGRLPFGKLVPERLEVQAGAPTAPAGSCTIAAPQAPPDSTSPAHS